MNWNAAQINPDAVGALDGIRVLDLSRLVAGNIASVQMADFGAKVTKVEPLPAGDPLRAWKTDGVSTFWKTYARNKESLALNYRKPGALDLLKKLIAESDVMIESFRPGTLEKMGLGIEVLHEIQPKLVLLRVSGFGQSGPYSPRPGFGTLVEGMSGFASLNGEMGGGPILPPLALADMITGLYGSNAVMMAIRAAEMTGKGQVIDLALLDSMSSFMAADPADYQLTGKAKERVGNASNTFAPRNAYITSDGHYIAVSGSIQSTAERLFVTIGRADMNSDPRFMTNEVRVQNRDEVDAIVGGWIKARTRDEVMEIFEREGITAAPLYDVEDIIEDEHFIERELFVEVPDEDMGQVPIHSPVPKLSGTPGAIRSIAPQLGEHTHKILNDIDMDAGEIHSLLAHGVVEQWIDESEFAKTA